MQRMTISLTLMLNSVGNCQSRKNKCLILVIVGNNEVLNLLCLGSDVSPDVVILNGGMTVLLLEFSSSRQQRQGDIFAVHQLSANM